MSSRQELVCPIACVLLAVSISACAPELATIQPERINARDFADEVVLVRFSQPTSYLVAHGPELRLVPGGAVRVGDYSTEVVGVSSEGVGVRLLERPLPGSYVVTFQSERGDLPASPPLAVLAEGDSSLDAALRDGGELPDAGERTCPTGMADCDGNRANGCETRLGSTLACQGCGDSCSRAGALTSCGPVGCQLDSCLAGRGDCNLNPTDGCESDLNDDSANCGRCGNSCAEIGPNTAGCRCESGRLVFGCAAGFGDCNADSSDGCEESLRSNSRHCGMCGRVCECEGFSCD